jgi:hypothetical protein
MHDGCNQQFAGIAHDQVIAEMDVLVEQIQVVENT